jgi:predicted phage terminase large subunit-like protein
MTKIKKDRQTFSPKSEKQRLILTDDTSDILLCGGGAGGSKSFSCLLKALKYVQDPAARVLIVRESYPTIKLSGGLWDESHNIYNHFGGTPKVQRLTWVFKNGATIQFAALPDNIDEWRGLQASHILVDEAATFRESDILFLLSRLRSANYKGHMNLTMTCNPDNSSFLFPWISYSLGDDGVPVAGTENKIRYFVNIEGGIKWGDSKEELFEKWGHGKELGVNFNPKSFRFIPLTVHDNPTLLNNNPAYLDNLMSLPHVEQLIFLKGSWTAKDTGAMYFNRDWCEMVNHPPLETTGRVRAWDFAATEASQTGVNSNPDWTASVKMSRDKYGNYYVEDVERFRYRTERVLKEVIRIAHEDGVSETDVHIPTDVGAAGKVAAQYYLRVLSENGVYARTKAVSGHSSKMARFKPLCALAEAGHLKVVRASWNDAFFAELENFKEDKKEQRLSKDDQVDSCADAFAALARAVTLPTFALPSMPTLQSPIPKI